MKNTILYLFLMAATVLVQAQVPSAIPYQAVARNTAGNLVANQNIAVRFSIRDGSAGGTIVYQERHIPTTNVLGLFDVNVGQGSVLSGTFAGINWGSGAKFIQVELDPAGGTSYINMGTSQMMSVPYALHAGSAASTSEPTEWTYHSKVSFSNSIDTITFSSLPSQDQWKLVFRDVCQDSTSMGLVMQLNNISSNSYLTVLRGGSGTQPFIYLLGPSTFNPRGCLFGEVLISGKSRTTSNIKQVLIDDLAGIFYTSNLGLFGHLINDPNDLHTIKIFNSITGLAYRRSGTIELWYRNNP